MCMRWFSQSNSSDVVGFAITSFGHIARIHGNLNLGTVLPLLERLHDNPELAGRVEDAWDDIARFLNSGSKEVIRHSLRQVGISVGLTSGMCLN